MDIKQLRAFLTIAETGSVTRASEVLHIVQPAVSRQLRLLEEDLGTPLFYRGRHGMEPTEAGTILIDRARRVLRELDQARDEIRPEPGALSGLVSVGLLPSTSDLLAAPLVCRLQELYPELEVNVTAVLPVSPEVRHWFASPRAAVGFLLHAATMDTTALGLRRSLTMPGLSATVADEIEALRRVAGDEAVALICAQPDETIARIVDGWPGAFDARRASALGFAAERDFDEIVRVYVEDEMGGALG